MDPVIICKILGRDSFKIIIVVKDRIILHNAEYCLMQSCGYGDYGFPLETK